MLEYDHLNRVKQQVDAGNGVTQFEYDAGDRMTRLTDPRNLVTRWEYDGFGQLWTYVNPDTGSTTQVWNAAGQRTSAARADGVAISYAHADPLGRLTSTTYGLGPNAVTHNLTWDTGTTCDAGKGRICRIDDPHQSLELGYDAYGALTRQRATIGAASYQHRYIHDDLGRLRVIEYPGNVVVEYLHTLDQVSAVNATINGQLQPLASSIQLQADTVNGTGLVYRAQYGDGFERNTYFDVDGRLYAAGSGVGQGFKLDFDANERIEYFTNYANGNWSQGYTYDDLDRLTGITSSLGNQSFTHDANGNRLSHTQGAGTSTYTIAGSNNRIDTISGSLNRSYSYKTTGQVRQITGPLSQGQGLADLLQPQARTTHAQPKAGDIFADGFEPDPVNAEYSFSYDRANRLSAITGPGLNASYQIGATGMRVAKTADSQTTHFVYSLDGQLLYEHDTSQNRRTQHIYLNGQPIALVRNNTAYWVHTDHLGRPELIADQTGATAWRARLTAFNRTVATDSIGGYHLGFPGQYHDTETGFAYNIHRDYDPATGRYLQSDPTGVGGGVNTYAYVEGNPVMMTDPFGLEGVGYWNNGGSMESLSQCQQAALLDSILNLTPYLGIAKQAVEGSAGFFDYGSSMLSTGADIFMRRGNRTLAAIEHRVLPDVQNGPIRHPRYDWLEASAKNAQFLGRALFGVGVAVEFSRLRDAFEQCGCGGEG